MLDISYWSLNFFFLSAGARFFSFFFNIFSIASGIGKSEREVTWDNSWTDLDLTISALAACISGSSHSAFTKSLVSFKDVGNVP